jgi:xylulokinase
MVIPPREPGEAEQPPRLFIAALEALFADLKAAGFDTSAIAAINTSGQQHGHVYLNDQAKACSPVCVMPPAPSDTPAEPAGDSFAYGGAPIWKTANTAAEAEHIREAVGGKEAIIRRTGSDMPLRFSATVHRKLAIRYPAAYAATRHILQISSFIPAILAGDCTIPIDFGNACGTGLMNYSTRQWDDVVMNAVAGDLPGGAAALAAKLPPIAHPLAVCGSIAAYFQKKYGLAADCKIIAGSGDNPQSKVLATGDLLSLGTSFVYMISSPDGSVDMAGTANAMYDGLGRPFNFGCRTNGALAWDRLRLRHGLGAKDYAACDASLANVAPGSRIRFWHPDTESFPIVHSNPEPVRLDDGPADFAHDFAAVVDSSLGLVYRYGMKIAGPGAADDKSADQRLWRPVDQRRHHEAHRRHLEPPCMQAGQAGAALGAAVAAAVALVPEGERETQAETLRQAIFTGKGVIQPDPEMVKAYHAEGGYLDQLEVAFRETAQALSIAAKPVAVVTAPVAIFHGQTPHVKKTGAPTGAPAFSFDQIVAINLETKRRSTSGMAVTLISNLLGSHDPRRSSPA